MNRYQPGDQMRDGIQTHIILDTKTNTIYPEHWYHQPHRDAVLEYLNKRTNVIAWVEANCANLNSEIEVDYSISEAIARFNVPQEEWKAIYAAFNL